MTEVLQPNNIPIGHLTEKDVSLRDLSEGKEPTANASERSNSVKEEVEYQWGVQKARAITSIWDNKSKWTLFIM
jgi:hypothetical protein